MNENMTKSYEKGRAWIEVSREAIKHNITAFRNILGDGVRLMPAVKANAYGHGAVLFSKELEKIGVYDFCVASAEEGVELREGGIKGKILVLGYTHPDNFPLLKEYDLMQTIVSYEYALQLNEYGALKTHLAIDTGMHRIGISFADRDKISAVYKLNNVSVMGIFSHLCVADSDDEGSVNFSKSQIERFTALLDFLSDSGIDYKEAHIQSSFGILNYETSKVKIARPGIAAYGLTCTHGDYVKHGTQLSPVLSLKTRVICLRDIPEGDGLGYGLAFTAQRNTKIAVLSIGYADGFPRSLSCGVGSAIVNGKKVPIAGRICMDLCFIDVTDVESVNVGDEVTLIGKDGDEEISALELAEKTNTITNEILTSLGQRLKRIVV